MKESDKMKFAVIYSIIGSVLLTFMVTFGDLFGKIREKGFGIGWMIFGCIMVIVVWPYYAYIAIKAALSND